MYFKQFYLGCLAHASYLIGSEGEAVVVDPRRDVDEYLAEAAAHGLRIRWIVETHLHADFVSGHRELAERTGATIVFGEKARAAFPHRAVREGDLIRLGRVSLRFLETPGHTPESISVVVVDGERGAEPVMVLTGDTLFIGDVGRPDLAADVEGLSAHDMAGLLYDSLHTKLLALPDAVQVYPAHGAGSLCGKNISSETSSTIGEQRRHNYALQPMSRERFVEVMTTDLPEVPAYFTLDVALNRQGAAPLADRPLPALSAAEVAGHQQRGAVVLDVRASAEYGAAHLPGALNIGLQGQFASWAGTLIQPGRGMVLVAGDAERGREAAMRLARVGLEGVAGYLDGGVEAWEKDGRELLRLPQIAVDELRVRRREQTDLQVLDVRRPGEFAHGHVPGALSLPLHRLPLELDRVARDRPAAVICAGGYRSSAASSLLAQHGFRSLANVIGGTSAWVAAGYETETEPAGG